MSCPSCSSLNSCKLFSGINADRPTSDKIAILQCKDCGLMFSDWTEINTADLYFEGYYGESTKTRTPNKIAVSIFQEERKRLALGKLQGGTILDAGCGDAGFLESLSENWVRYGYEPSTVGKDLSSSKAGITLLDTLDFSKTDAVPSFDIITFWQSLEHINNPIEILKTVHSLLKPGGILFISVPNIQSLQAGLFGGRWFHLDPTRHIVHYNPKSLTQLIESAGFKLEKLNTRSLEFGLFGWLQSFLNIFPGRFNELYRRLKGRKVSDMRPLSVLSILFYFLVIPPLLFVSGLLFLIETAAGKGGVINATFKK